MKCSYPVLGNVLYKIQSDYGADEAISGAGVETQMQRTDVWPQGWEGGMTWESRADGYARPGVNRRLVGSRSLAASVCSEGESPQSCPTLCDPVDYPVHGILQARILEWVAFPFSRRSRVRLLVTA